MKLMVNVKKEVRTAELIFNYFTILHEKFMNYTNLEPNLIALTHAIYTDIFLANQRKR